MTLRIERWPRWMAVTLLACALAPLSTLTPVGAWAARGAAGADPTAPRSRATAVAHEWPNTWQGSTLRPLAMTAVEQRFASRFPGAIARFTDDERVIVLRHVTQPTRMLHPATDCFRALGYRIHNARLERADVATPANDDAVPLKRCFEAERDGERLRVCEHIVGQRGDQHTDTSAWFWAASMGKSQGPWLAVTVVEGL